LQNNTFSTLFVGQNLIRLSEVDSTNNFLKTKASNSEPLPEGTVIMADHQFAGRGQQGNVWHTEAGLNLTFSLYLCPSFLPITRQFMLNMAISIAVRNALEGLTGSGLKVKWPNDLYYYDQKLGGILIENILAGSSYKAGIIGIGVNVNQVLFSPEVQNRATSLRKILQRDVNLISLLAEICRHIEQQYLKLRQEKYRSLTADYLSGLYRFKESALYRQNGEVFEGQIVNVTDSGMLVIFTDGREVEFNFKEVEFLT
jgi:BirA family biotin operon repressor/biotin-[acetyl-CoA-carboxylase] ligase